MEDPSLLFTLCAIFGGFLLAMGWLFHTFSMDEELGEGLQDIGGSPNDSLAYAPEGAEGALSGVGSAILNFENDDTQVPMPSFFSFRVFRVILLIFGLGGNFGLFMGWDIYSSFVLGLVAGLIAGWIAHWMLKFIYRQVIYNQKDPVIVGRIGNVILDIPPNGLGKILLIIVHQRMTFRAKSNTGLAIPTGSKIQVLRKENGICTVKRHD